MRGEGPDAGARIAVSQSGLMASDLASLASQAWVKFG
jgi:hypothetical protein